MESARDKHPGETKVRFSRILKEAKLCLSYHKRAHAISPAIQFTL